MTSRFAALANCRILVVEDEAMIAMMLEDVLQDFGCIVELAPSIDDALQSLRAGAPDGVLLDMNIHGTRTFVIAEELANRAVPFLLVTGYGAGNADPPVIKAAPRLLKPFSSEELGRRMVDVFLGGAGAAA